MERVVLVKWDGHDAVVIEHDCGHDRAIDRVSPVTITSEHPLTVAEPIRCPECGLEGRITEGGFHERRAARSL